MRCSPTIRWRTRSDETACATAVLLLLIGALVSAATVGWIIWTGVLATAVIAATLGVVVIVVASSRGRRLRLPPGVPLAAFVIVAAVDPTTGPCSLGGVGLVEHVVRGALCGDDEFHRGGGVSALDKELQVRVGTHAA
jgi:energy-coupling factor transporter transmembrane protein EcfT